MTGEQQRSKKDFKVKTVWKQANKNAEMQVQKSSEKGYNEYEDTELECANAGHEQMEKNSGRGEYEQQIIRGDVHEVTHHKEMSQKSSNKATTISIGIYSLLCIILIKMD